MLNGQDPVTDKTAKCGEVLIRNGRANPGAQGAEYAQTADRGDGGTGQRGNGGP